MEYPQIKQINRVVWHIDGKAVAIDPDSRQLGVQQLELFALKTYERWKYWEVEADGMCENWKRHQLRAIALKGWVTRLRKQIESKKEMRMQERMHYTRWRIEGEMKIDKLDQDLANMRLRVEGAERTNNALMHQNDELRKRIAELENPKPAEPFKLSNWAENRTDPPDEKIPNLKKSIY